MNTVMWRQINNKAIKALSINALYLNNTTDTNKVLEEFAGSYTVLSIS
jgi:hypothetical protein